MEIDSKSVGTLPLTQMFKCTHAKMTEKSYWMASFIHCEVKCK